MVVKKICHVYVTKCHSCVTSAGTYSMDHHLLFQSEITRVASQRASLLDYKHESMSACASYKYDPPLPVAADIASIVVFVGRVRRPGKGACGIWVSGRSPSFDEATNAVEFQADQNSPVPGLCHLRQAEFTKKLNKRFHCVRFGLVGHFGLLFMEFYDSKNRKTDLARHYKAV
jgi:hypothetical protein